MANSNNVFVWQDLFTCLVDLCTTRYDNINGFIYAPTTTVNLGLGYRNGKFNTTENYGTITGNLVAGTNSTYTTVYCYNTVDKSNTLINYYLLNAGYADNYIFNSFCVWNDNHVWCYCISYIETVVYHELNPMYSQGDYTGMTVSSKNLSDYPSSGYLLTGDIIGWFELVDE